MLLLISGIYGFRDIAGFAAIRESALMDNTYLILGILLTSCVINAVGDVFLLWGVRYTNWQPGIEALAKTPVKYVLFGSLIGMVIIPAWFLILPYLANIGSTAGRIAFMSFAIYVSAVFTFHVSFSFVALGVQASGDLKVKFERIVGLIAGYSFLAAIVFTVSMIFLGVEREISMTWFHYITLPLFTIIGIQMVLGKVLKRLPYYRAVSGTVAMALFFIGFMDMVRRNPEIFCCVW